MGSERDSSGTEDSAFDGSDDRSLLNTDTLRATGEYLINSRAFAEYKDRFRHFLYPSHAEKHEEEVAHSRDAVDIDVQPKSSRPDLNSGLYRESKQVGDTTFPETTSSMGHDDEAIGLEPQIQQGERPSHDLIDNSSEDARPRNTATQPTPLFESPRINEVVDLAFQSGESQRLAEEFPFLEYKEVENNDENPPPEVETLQKRDNTNPRQSPPSQLSTTAHIEINQEYSLTRDGDDIADAADALWWRGSSRHSRQEPDLEDDMSDTMSVMSYIESIFGTQSTRSTASSAPGNAPVLLSAFVNLLVRDPSVDRMFSRALSSNGIGHERFSRNFSRILRSYSRGLERSLAEDEVHADDQAYRQAVAFVSSKSLHTCNLIASRYVNMEQRPVSPTLTGRDKSLDTEMIIRQLDALKLQATDSDNPQKYDGDGASAADGESDAEQQTFRIENLESFLASGEPFRLLKWKLRALVIPDQFLSRVQGTVDGLLGLFPRDGLPKLLAKAFRSWQKFRGSFSIEIQHLIEELAIKLRIECHNLGQKNVAEFLLVYSQYISVRVEEALPSTNTLDSRTKKDSPPEETVHDDLPQSTRSKGVLEDIVANRLPGLCEADFPAHWGFLASTAAFMGLIESLQDLAFSTFFSQAKKLIMEVDDEEGRRLLPILTELQWTVARIGKERKPEFTIRQENEAPTIGDRLKLAVEASTGSEWDWWPLQAPPRHYHDHPSCEVIIWTCVGHANAAIVGSWTCVTNESSL